MKLNLGCGNNHMEGYVNVDKEPACNPDQVIDLEKMPWPFEDNSATDINLIHTLEHLGRDPDLFLGIMKELYRISAPQARIEIAVPHPRHNKYIVDPTHVRPILPETLEMFSRAKNRQWREAGNSNTPLADILDVDFAIESVHMDLDEHWQGKMAAGTLTQDEVIEAITSYNNVVSQVIIVVRAVKG